MCDSFMDYLIVGLVLFPFFFFLSILKGKVSIVRNLVPSPVMSGVGQNQTEDPILTKNTRSSQRIPFSLNSPLPFFFFPIRCLFDIPGSRIL